MNKRLDQLTKAELLARLKIEMANNHQKDGQLIQLGADKSRISGELYTTKQMLVRMSGENTHLKAEVMILKARLLNVLPVTTATPQNPFKTFTEVMAERAEAAREFLKLYGGNTVSKDTLLKFMESPRWKYRS